MPTLQSTLAATVALLFATGNAHMIMSSPASYGSPDNSPLDASGSNFPCKATSNAGATVTNMAIGEQQILSFFGSATHGGGSCQVSLTTDNPATKNSRWFVIHSIEGGCPARLTPGNLPDGGNPDTTADPDTYKYSIPAGIAPGAYTLAWTWFNKVGNREMYMNCASIKVTGGSSKRDLPRNEYEDFFSSRLSERATASFPAMFVANIGDGCTTAEGGDLKFPDPGTSVETNTGYIPMAPVGNCATGGSSSSAGSASSGPTSNSSSASSGSASSAGSSSGAPDSASSASSGGDAQSAASAAPSMAVAAPAVSPPVIAAPVADTASAAGSNAPTSSAAPTSSGSASSGATTSPCSTPGQSICSPDNTEIGTCSQASTVTWVKLAEGTKCSEGNVVAAKRWIS